MPELLKDLVNLLAASAGGIIVGLGYLLSRRIEKKAEHEKLDRMNKGLDLLVKAQSLSVAVINRDTCIRLT